jgi:predicted secreted protein
MKQSPKIALLCHCILNPYAKVCGISNNPSSNITQQIQKLIQENVGIIQLPCPEISALGYRRFGVVKDQLDSPTYRANCKKILEDLIVQLQDYHQNGAEFVKLIGIDGSPSCGIFRTCRGDWGGELYNNPKNQAKLETLQWVEEQGIFIEELLSKLGELGINIPLESIEEIH